MRPSDEIITQYKKKICGVAKAFDAFCSNHSLRYFAIGGTAIGALRHKGIIPWDDDIDFVMPRPDYERFLQITNELQPEYDIFTYQNNPMYHSVITKMCDANTSLVIDPRVHTVVGAFIDIFPLDACLGETNEEREKFFYTTKAERLKAENLRMHYFFRDLLSSIKRRQFDEICDQMKSHCHHFLRNNVNEFERYENIVSQTSYENSEYITYFGTHYGAKNISLREWFDDYFYAPFEDFEIRLPKGIHEYLTKMFLDYMAPPPPEKRIALHSFYYLNLDKRVSWEEAREEMKKEGEYK